MNINPGVNQNCVWIRGAGDLATGISVRLLNAGFTVIHSEIPQPTVIRATVAFASAIYNKRMTVEGFTACVCDTIEDIQKALLQNEVPVFIGDETSAVQFFKPIAFVEGTIRKMAVDMPRKDVPLTIGVGPGFIAPLSADAVIETMRGHDLGRVIWQGEALPNTGIPGEVGGFSKERVIHAPVQGVITPTKVIGDLVQEGEVIAQIDQESVFAPITGILRGMIREGLWVDKNFKIADIDPRCKKEHCFTISDKARAIGGGVLEALLNFKNEYSKANQL